MVEKLVVAILSFMATNRRDCDFSHLGALFTELIVSRGYKGMYRDDVSLYLSSYQV